MYGDGTKIRSPGVAGFFYPLAQERLRGLIDSCHSLIKPGKPFPAGDLTGGIVPHAGMEYCGSQAVHFFDLLGRSSPLPETIVILHPDHYAMGPGISADAHDYWDVPNGRIKIDKELVGKLRLPSVLPRQDREHSAEVMVPYINHYLHGKVDMVCIRMLNQGPEIAKDTAARIYRAAKDLERRILLIASSDFSHFLPRALTRAMDKMVLDQICSRDTEGVFNCIRKHGISVCGYGPIMTLMEYSSLINPSYEVMILSRGDSGKMENNHSRNVVSYISAAFISRSGG